MNINTIQAVYFIGAGGIGMSALVRYFLSKGKKVGGYDRTPSELTEKLIAEGADIHYEENVSLIPEPRWWSIRLLSLPTTKNWFISRNISLRFTNVPRYWEC